MALACVALGLGAGVALWSLAARGPAAYAPLWLLALAAPVLLLAPNLGGWWLGQGRMVPMSRLTLAPPYLTLALLAGLWAAGYVGLTPVLGAWVAAKALVGVVLCGVLWRRGGWGVPDFAALRVELPFVATIGLTNLVSLLNYRVGLFVVEGVLGLGATGVYSIAVVVAELLWFVSSSLTQRRMRGSATPTANAPRRRRCASRNSASPRWPSRPRLWVVAWLGLPGCSARPTAQLAAAGVLLPGALLFGAASGAVGLFHQPRRAAAGGGAGRAAVAGSQRRAGAAARATAGHHRRGAGGVAGLCGSVGVLAARFARHAGMPLARVLRAAAATGGRPARTRRRRCAGRCR